MERNMLGRQCLIFKTMVKGKIIGYQVNIKNTKKSFCVSTDTMDERLEKANKYLTQTKGQSAG